MSEQYSDLEAYVAEVTRSFEYPPTPDISARLRVTRSERRASSPMRWGWSVAAVVVVIIMGLMAVPDVRAEVLKVLRIGGISLLMDEITPTAIEDTAAPTEYLPSRFDLSELVGETTLEEAQAVSGFDIQVPTYPEDLGLPDRVFYSTFGPETVILVWTVEGNVEQAELALFVLAEGVTGTKGPPEVVEETIVNGQAALWTVGPYVLWLNGNRAEFTWLVEGNVLLWEEDGQTYRLESGLSLEAARLIAESLETVK